MEIIGYHGTEEGCVNSIIKNGYNSSNEANWLGAGVYFFGDITVFNISGKQEAIDWAVYVRKFNSYGVFEALITSNDYIDIAGNAVHKELYESIRRETLDKHINAGKRKKDFKENLIFLKLEKTGQVDFIIALTDGAKNPEFPNYVIRRPQLQICIKNKASIKKNDLKYHGVRYESRD